MKEAADAAQQSRGKGKGKAPPAPGPAEEEDDDADPMGAGLDDMFSEMMGMKGALECIILCRLLVLASSTE